jgi:peptidoglycan/xylan/chitin deacetylase (PgdA/CDA1 family)
VEHIIIYDAIHGYQPFSEEFRFPWVKENLERIFLPTSEAMRQGAVKRSIQLQGCTIQEWLRDKETRDTAQKVLDNLKYAAQRRHIDVGCSAFSHPILPLLSEETIYAQIKADIDAVEANIGKATWFWPPEGAIDAKTLSVLHHKFPQLTAAIPNNCVGVNTCEFLNIKYGREAGKAAVFNVIVKDVLMNAVSYKQRPKYLKSVSWKYTKSFMREPQQLKKVLASVDRTKDYNHIILRDWENGESKDALFALNENSMDVQAFIEGNWRHSYTFRRLSEAEAKKTIPLDKVKLSCWEPMAKPANPLPYWEPRGTAFKMLSKKTRELITGWKKIYSIYDDTFVQIVRRNTGTTRNLGLKQRLDMADKAMKDRKVNNIFRQTSMALISCIPWHIMAKEEWSHDAAFSYRAMHRMVKPKMHHLLNFAHDNKYLSLHEQQKRKQEVDMIAAKFSP